MELFCFFGGFWLFGGLWLPREASGDVDAQKVVITSVLEVLDMYYPLTKAQGHFEIITALCSTYIFVQLTYESGM